MAKIKIIQVSGPSYLILYAFNVSVINLLIKNTNYVEGLKT